MKRRMRQVIMLGAATSAATLGFVMSATPAHAASPCQRVANGQLCVSHDWNGYNVHYDKWGGGAVYVDFNLKCANGRWFGDLGAFWVGAGESRSYFFSVGDQGACSAVLKDGYSGAALIWTDAV